MIDKTLSVFQILCNPLYDKIKPLLYRLQQSALNSLCLKDTVVHMEIMIRARFTPSSINNMVGLNIKNLFLRRSINIFKRVTFGLYILYLFYYFHIVFIFADKRYLMANSHLKKWELCLCIMVKIAYCCKITPIHYNTICYF